MPKKSLAWQMCEWVVVVISIIVIAFTIDGLAHAYNMCWFRDYGSNVTIDGHTRQDCFVYRRNENYLLAVPYRDPRIKRPEFTCFLLSKHASCYSMSYGSGSVFKLMLPHYQCYVASGSLAFVDVDSFETTAPAQYSNRRFHWNLDYPTAHFVVTVPKPER
jgi:hypothetical protein